MEVLIDKGRWISWAQPEGGRVKDLTGFVAAQLPELIRTQFTAKVDGDVYHLQCRCTFQARNGQVVEADLEDVIIRDGETGKEFVACVGLPATTIAHLTLLI